MSQPEDDWGCDHCRNDGWLRASGTCPKCDAQYPEEEDDDEKHS